VVIAVDFYSLMVISYVTNLSQMPIDRSRRNFSVRRIDLVSGILGDRDLGSDIGPDFNCFEEQLSAAAPTKPVFVYIYLGFSVLLLCPSPSIWEGWEGPPRIT
jgi:hypothetical protein